MGQSASVEDEKEQEKKKPVNSQPIPSRDSEGYKYLSKRVNELRKSLALEDGFEFIEKIDP